MIVQPLFHSQSLSGGFTNASHQSARAFRAISWRQWRGPARCIV